MLGFWNIWEGTQETLEAHQGDPRISAKLTNRTHQFVLGGLPSIPGASLFLSVKWEQAAQCEGSRVMRGFRKKPKCKALSTVSLTGRRSDSGNSSTFPMGVVILQLKLVDDVKGRTFSKRRAVL